MSNNKTVSVGSLSNRDTITGMVIIAFMFFMFGFTSWINAILIPYFKISFDLTHVQSYLVTFAFYISYLLFSVPASYLLKKVGFKRGMMIGFWVMSTGAFLFVPAAITFTYELFLLGLFSIGAGLALLQSAANPYITILGPKERAAQRFSIMGICNKGAGILAPLLFAAVIFRATDSGMLDSLDTMTPDQKNTVLHELIQRVIVPYACVGTFLFLIGLFIRYSPLPEIDTEHESDELAQANSSKTSIIQFPHLVLGAFAIFLHVGTQVISIDTVISYAATMNLNLIEAKVFPSYTLTAQICAYFVGIFFIPKFMTQLTALKASTIFGAILTLMIIYTKGDVTFLGHTNDISLWFVVMLGLANSLVWAGVWPLALDGLGRFTKVGASLMVMGLAGNAILPLIYGYFVDMWDARNAYWVLMPCYLYLIFYAFRGYRLRKWTS
jgi:glucose/galactose transporter